MGQNPDPVFCSNCTRCYQAPTGFGNTGGPFAPGNPGGQFAPSSPGGRLAPRR